MRLHKKILLGLMVIAGIGLYAYANLTFHAVYYAQNMPHQDGTEPDLVMLIEHMGAVYTPEIEGIRYDDDGANMIENSTILGEVKPRFSKFDGGYGFTNQNNTTYKFTKHFTLEWALDKDYKELEPSTVDEKEIKQAIRQTVQPVLDVQPKPTVNLQWLFNLIYQKRFN